MKPTRQFQDLKKVDLDQALKVAQIQKLQASAQRDRQLAFQESMKQLDPTRNLKN